MERRKNLAKYRELVEKYNRLYVEIAAFREDPGPETANSIVENFLTFPLEVQVILAPTWLRDVDLVRWLGVNFKFSTWATDHADIYVSDPDEYYKKQEEKELYGK